MADAAHRDEEPPPLEITVVLRDVTVTRFAAAAGDDDDGAVSGSSATSPAPVWTPPSSGASSSSAASSSSSSPPPSETSSAPQTVASAGARALELSGVSLALRPGTLTLLLAPPGHGKSALLRCAAGRLAAAQVSYNGVPVRELARRAGGLRARRLAALAEQGDCHLPQLTVRETLQFAALNALPDGHADAAPEAVARLGAALGLAECLDTPVGSETQRGISGGQRKRLTLGEALVAPAAVLCLDEVTTGLDAAVARQVVALVRARARLARRRVRRAAAALARDPRAL